VLHKAIKVRLYPTPEQEVCLAQHFGCARWWWNFGLNKSIETYRNTGKGLGRNALNALLPALKKSEETIWLADCYSQVLQAVTLNLTTAYKNFFEGRARFPRFRSKHGRQSIQYPQNVQVIGSCLKFPGRVGTVKAKIDRWFPSSKLCSNCYHQIDELPLLLREWTCPHCNTCHDRDGNAATNIRAEGIRMLQVDGASISADGGEVSLRVGRKSKLQHSLLKSETA